MNWLRRDEDDDAIKAAVAPRSCRDCGRLFVGQSALEVHRDGNRCLAEHVFESLLVNRDGAWCMRGSDSAR